VLTGSLQCEICKVVVHSFQLGEGTKYE